MTLDEAIKHAEEVMDENLEKTKGRNASDPIAINCFECADNHRQLAEWLKELKQLKEQTRWIPVSEKRSDAGEDVLVTVNLGSVRVVGMDMYSLVEKDGFEGYGKDVVAWMPLPAAYEPQESE